MYGSEVWGASLKDDFGYWDKHSIEKTHLHFCKTFLGVNKKASNIGCRAEMGRFPFTIDIDTRILKYWIHLDSLGDNNVVKQAFIMSKTLNDTGHKSFHSHIRGLLDKMGRPKSDILYPSKFNIRTGIKQLQDKYITIWREKLENSEKLRFYSEIKSNYEYENYLESVENISFRKELTKLRISNHNLLIERGRYCSPKLPREERLCSFCSECKLEDEKHFLLDCQFYNEDRNSLKLWPLVIKYIDFNKLDLTQKLEILFKNSDPEFSAVFSKHVFTCMKKRNDYTSS